MQGLSSGVWSRSYSVFDGALYFLNCLRFGHPGTKPASTTAGGPSSAAGS